MRDDITACPECDSPQLRTRTTKDPTHRCIGCGAEFDDPVERPPRTTMNRSHQAKYVARMDPEDVGLSPKGER